MLTDENLEEIRETIKELRPKRPIESETCRRLVEPMLSFLGWSTGFESGTDKRNYKMIGYEYNIKKPGTRKGKKPDRVDYALFAKEESLAVLVEAKKLGKLDGDKKFEDDEVLQQAREYAQALITNRGLGDLVSIVLTDGNTWKFYRLSRHGLDYYPDWCHTLKIEEIDEASKVRDDLNRLLARKRILSAESREYLAQLFRSDRIDGACKEILKGHKIRRQVKLAFGERMEEIMALGKEVMEKGKIKDCKPEQKEVEEVILKRIISTMGSVEKPDAKQDRGNKESSKDKRGKPKKPEVKWGNKEFKDKEAIQIMHDVIAEFANEFGIKAVARGANKCRGRGIPTVMAEKEVDKYRESRKSVTCDPILGHPNYVFLKGLSIDRSDGIANRLKLLAKALGVTQFEVKLDGKLHR